VRCAQGTLEDGTLVPLCSLRNDVSWTLWHFAAEDSMELAVVVVALIVAGALIPDHSKIVFYR
jgi:hypothetical protein